jgi:hypothetical protein
MARGEAPFQQGHHHRLSNGRADKTRNANEYRELIPSNHENEMVKYSTQRSRADSATQRQSPARNERAKAKDAPKDLLTTFEPFDSIVSMAALFV